MAVQDYKINYKSDFVLTINGDAGWATQFCIKFWTGMPSQAYFVGFDGVKYVNCRVGDTPTQLLVMFDDHHLPIGKLEMQIAYHTTIEEFPGSVFDEVTNARDVIVTIDGTDYQVLLDFTGEDAPELEFDLPAYANEAERIQNELQRQQNEAARIAAELQREQATAAAVQGAENVNAQLNGTILTVTNRQGVSTSVNTKGEQGAQGPVGPEGPQGEQGETGISIVSFTPKSETSTILIYTVTFSDGHIQDVPIPKGAKGDTGATGPQGPQGDTGVSITSFTYASETETDMIYTVTFSDGTTQSVAIPKGAKGDTGLQGPVGPQGPQGPMGDVAVITPEQQAAFTMYSVPGQNTDGPMTQKAVTDALVAGSISYDNSQSGLSAENVQGALDEITPELKSNTIKIGQLGDACFLDDSSSATTQMTGLQGKWTGDGTIGTTANIRAHLKINAKGYNRMILTTPEGYYSYIHYVNDSNVNMGAVIERWTNGTVSMMLSGQYDIMLNIKYQEAGTTNITTSMLSGITWGVTLISDVEYEPAAPFSMMEKCVNLNGGTSRNIYNVNNRDFSNLAHTNVAAKSRLKLDKYALINTYGCVHINALIPYSAVSADTHIDRVSIPMYDKNRNYLSSLDLGWYYFNGSDVTIDVDLSDETYKDVAYIGLFFGAASAKTSILNSSLDTSNIAIALTLKDDYKGFAANNENIDGNDWERTITELDIIESNYTYIAFTSTTRGAFIIDARLLNDFEANISVSSGSTIKVAIQGWTEYNKNSGIYDSTWITAGSSYTAKNWTGIKYIALVFTYISGNTGIPTLAEIHEYISLSFKSKKKGLIERIEKLDSPCEAPIPVNWRNQLTTTVYMGEKIDISDNVYTYESIGTLQSGVSSRQGGAAYGNYLFQFHDTLATICVFDMSTGTNVDKLTLTANPNCHAGSGGFSNTFYDNTDPFPLLYISSMDEKKIFVYRITGTVGNLSISLIQTITLQMPYYLPNITIDAENNRIVIFAYTKNSWGDAEDNQSVIMYCTVPSYNTDITISDFDGVFLTPFIMAEQGAFARYGLLYLSYGNTGTTPYGGGIIVIDYVAKTIRNLIGLLAIGSLEPEACVKWNGSIVFTTQSGTVYKLMFN